MKYVSACWVLTLLAFVLIPASLTAAAPRPNVLVFYADDLDFDEVNLYDLAKFPSHTGMRQQGFYNGKKDQGDYFDPPRFLMPNLERLASEGLVLDRFYITSPICTPSRYTTLTGRYASRSKSFQNRQPAGGPASVDWSTGLQPSEANVAKALRDAGYATGIVGKWHLGHGVSKYTDDLKKLDPLKPEDNARIRAAQQGTCDAFGALGFDFAQSIYVSNVGSIKIPSMLKREHLGWVTQGAMNFLDQQDADDDQPFFLYMSLPLPHAQYYDQRNRSGGSGAGWVHRDPRATPGGYLDEAPTVLPPREDVLRRVRDAGLPDVNAMATRLDDVLGAVMAKLEERGLAENTVLIVTSDHQSRGKNTVYESGRVPFVVRWPGRIPAGQRSDMVCGNVDLPNTFLEWAGVDAPAGDSGDPVGLDGVSLAEGLMRPGASPAPRDALLLECMYTRAVVTDRWKMVAGRAPDAVDQLMAEDALRAKREQTRRYVGWDGRTNDRFKPGFSYGVIMDSDRDFPHYFDPDQLYDLHTDPFEQHNLVAPGRQAGEHAERLSALQQRLRGFLKTLPHTFEEFTP